jgi:hypothetical protein
VVFTAHLFEGYTKRGANDNMGGPAIQLEILRALHHLIDAGHLPRPRRSIHFIWPNEISGTYEFLRRDPALVEKLAVNINMDMVSEGLRQANSWFTMSETPAELASFYDGLAASILNYVWRTNDIVYLPDSPRGRPGGQYFPDPMWEKNGSRDAFRFFIHEATGGSDHIVFNNPAVGVPGIEFFTWPDQWYHADTDTPDKGDPTEMRRVAFIGATTAWVSANLEDPWVPGLVEAVSDFGFNRVAERGLPRAMEVLDGGNERSPEAATELAMKIVEASVARERDALGSIHAIHTGSQVARARVEEELEAWGAYRRSLRDFVMARAGLAFPGEVSPPSLSPEEEAYGRIVPELAEGIRGQEFSFGRYSPAQEYLEARPEALEEMGLGRVETREIMGYIDGERSILEIRDRVVGALGVLLTVRQVARYVEFLEEVGWVELREAG